MRIALATCQRLPEPDPDQAPLIAALRDLGIETSMLAWDGPQADATGFDLCAFRSTWNYFEDAERFLSWVAATARTTRLVNSERIVRWNIHKSYLKELEAAGIHTVPTAWVARGDAPAFAEILEPQGWAEVVVKPAVSAASFGTRRLRADQADEGSGFVAELATRGDVMIQPYLASVDEAGEKALVWIDGELTHAVRKNPRFSGDDEEVSDAIPISADERDLALAAVACAPERPLYARIDLMRDDAGAPCVSELELIEPSLFFPQAPHALARYVDALRRMVE